MSDRLRRRPRTVRTVAPAAASALAAAPVAVIAITSTYLSVLTVAAWTAFRRGDRTTPPTSHRSSEASTSFTILVPAHDEELLVAETVDRLMALDYPRHLFDVHVVADHCGDLTVEVARDHGALVLENADPDVRGKGPALRWAFDHLDSKAAIRDVVVFVDADTSADNGLLRAFDRRFAGGAVATQAYYAVRDPAATPAVAMRAAALAVRHYLRPLARCHLGGTCGLFGNGMGFRADVYRSRQMSGHLTEDLELQLELVLGDDVIEFVPEAVVEAEMPSTAAAARTQNERWESGRIDLTRRYVPRLVRSALGRRARRRLTKLDTAVDLVLPPFSVLVAATAASTAIAVGGAGSGRLGRIIAGVAIANVVAQAFHVLSALRMVRAPAAVYRALASAPGVVAWKVALWVRALSGRTDSDWIRTARNPE
ncbi:MAG TPA: glycosyltransferase family 2 protein [Ilumatobacteraceae bacterium]|nr:glycosyltransferase family 2 protein [Ilumatobacteraceae bacterium]